MAQKQHNTITIKKSDIDPVEINLKPAEAPRPVGRPPKEAGIHDLILALKEVDVLIKRIRPDSRYKFRMRRVTSSIRQNITILEKIDTPQD